MWRVLEVVNVTCIFYFSDGYLTSLTSSHNDMITYQTYLSYLIRCVCFLTKKNKELNGATMPFPFCILPNLSSTSLVPQKPPSQTMALTLPYEVTSSYWANGRPQERPKGRRRKSFIHPLDEQHILVVAMYVHSPGQHPSGSPFCVVLTLTVFQ